MEFSNKSQKHHSKLLFCLFFILLVCDSSFVMQKQMSGTVRIVIDLIAACGIFALIRPKITQKSLLSFFLLIIFPVFWLVFSGDVKQTIIVCVSIFVGWIVCVSISQNLFLIMYGKAMMFLSVFSLISLFTYELLPFVIKAFPIAHQNAYYVSYNLIFSVITQTGDLLRNYGVFWEPGAFAVFLCIALWAELFFQETKLINVIIYITTIITTFSTFGLITCFMLLITYLFRNKSINNKIRNMIVLFLFFAIVWLVLYGESFINEIFGKIINMNESATTRWNSIVYVGQLFLSAPVFGVGISRFLDFSEEYLSGMATNTFMNCIAMHGILGGSIPIIGSLRFFVKVKAPSLSKLMLFFFGILLFSTQAFEQISLFYAFVFYGLLLTVSSNRKEENL